MGWRKHVDEDAELVKEIKQDKIERATRMLERGQDLEDIKADVWDKVDVQCQGTCQGWLTKEENESGIGMCQSCFFEVMD